LLGTKAVNAGMCGQQWVRVTGRAAVQQKRRRGGENMHTAYKTKVAKEKE